MNIQPPNNQVKEFKNMKQNFQNQPQDTGSGPYLVAPPMCDPMQHGQTQPYPPIVPPEGETKSETVPPSRETKSRGDGFCRGFCAGLCCYCCLDFCF